MVFVLPEHMVIGQGDIFMTQAELTPGYYRCHPVVEIVLPCVLRGHYAFRTAAAAACHYLLKIY